MVLDTSAVIAAITNEQDSSRFRAAMLGAESLLISSVAVLETKIVLFARLGLDAVGLFEELVYALAKVRSQPLLFKGDDFDRTDIDSALV